MVRGGLVAGALIGLLACGSDDGTAAVPAPRPEGSDAAAPPSHRETDAPAPAHGENADAALPAADAAVLAADAGAVPTATGGCVAAATAQRFDDRVAFEAFLLGATRSVGFDDVGVDGGDPVAIDEDRYHDSHGVRILGSDGQYVHDGFGWGETDYVPSSEPNMYAPGPDTVAGDGGHETEVSFPVGNAPGCVSGFGAVFIDVDYPSIARSSLSVYGADDRPLGAVDDFSGPTASQIFVGLASVDAEGRPVRGVRRAVLVNGNVFPADACCEGVTLDDFVFDSPR